MVNLDKLTTVKKNYSKAGQTCDLRYSQSQEKFFLKDETFRTLGMGNKGFTFHYDPDSKDCFLSVRPHDDAVMFKGREDHESKSNGFASSEFKSHLEDFGWIPEDEEHDLLMNMEKAGEVDGIPFYKLVNVTNESETSTETTSETGSDQDVQNTSQEQEAQAPAFGR